MMRQISLEGLYPRFVQERLIDSLLQVVAELSYNRTLSVV